MAERTREQARLMAGDLNEVFTALARMRRRVASTGQLHDVARVDAWLSLVKAELDEANDQAGMAPVLWPMLDEADTEPERTVVPSEQ